MKKSPVIRSALMLLTATSLPSLTPATAAVFTSETKLTASDAAADDLFGSSVAVSGDTAVVGAHWKDDTTGAAYVFVRSGGVWTQQQKLTAGDPAAGDQFGLSVAISGDTAVVSAPWKDDGDAAYVFVRSGSVWTQQQKLTASDARHTSFGRSSVSGDTVVIGAPFDNSAGSAAGSAYVFVRSGGVWNQQQKLFAGDAKALDEFGYAVAVSGDTVVIGAPAEMGGAPGAAYVFERSGGIWIQQQKLIASDAVADDRVGASVSLSGDTVVIGVPLEDTAGFSSGAAYVFVRSGGVWTQQQKLTASDAAAHAHFGDSVSVSGATVVIGAPFHHHPSNFSGSAYIFVRNGGIWSQQPKLTASDTAAGDFFGRGVSFSGGTLVIGATGDDDGGSGSGSAYVFEGDTTPPTITRVTAAPAVLWPPNHSMVSVTVTVAATDDSGAAPTCRIISVTSNESADGAGDTAPDWEITGALSANLRAERSGQGSGRIYTIVVECKDASGNAATGSVTVTVPGSQRKKP